MSNRFNVNPDLDLIQIIPHLDGWLLWPKKKQIKNKNTITTTTQNEKQQAFFSYSFSLVTIRQLNYTFE